MRRRSLLILAAAASAGVAAQAGAASSAPRCTASWHAFAPLPAVDLVDVAALSPTNVWAVGKTGPANAERPRILHWDGRRATVTSGFRPSVFYRTFTGKHLSGWLAGVAAVSASDVWAVGADGQRFGGKSRPVVEHWDGGSWRVVATPALPADAALTDVTAVSRTDVWAVGQVGTRPLYEHWDGSRWRAIVAGREGALHAVDGLAGNEVWTVGAQGLLGRSIHDISGLSLRWNGRRWHDVPDPDDTGNQEGLDAFSGVTVLSPTNVWGMRAKYASRWDGRHWHDVLFPTGIAKHGNIFWDIAAAGPADIWAVGETNYEFPLIVHWNGKAWSESKTPFPRRLSRLLRLSVLSSTEVWAAGDHLLARYSCG